MGRDVSMTGEVPESARSRTLKGSETKCRSGDLEKRLAKWEIME